MTVQEALQKRRSVRKYTDEPVSPELTELLLHAAMSGPSACNKKPWRFCVITDAEKLAALRKASHFTGIKAPMAIVVCGDLSRALPLQLADFWIQDCSAATQNILLQAVELGLGTVWCGIHPQKQPVRHVSQLLGLTPKQVPLNIIWVGHPAEQPDARDQYDEKCVMRF